jgi:hypothetical protein
MYQGLLNCVNFYLDDEAGVGVGVHGSIGHPGLRRLRAYPGGVGTGAPNAGRVTASLIQVPSASLLAHPLQQPVKINVQ